MKLRFVLLAFVLSIFFSAARADEIELISGYPGAKLVQKGQLDFAEFSYLAFPVNSKKYNTAGGIDEEAKSIQAGEFYGRVYTMPSSDNSSKVYYGYLNRLKGMGYKITASCTPLSCPYSMYKSGSGHYYDFFVEQMAQKRFLTRQVAFDDKNISLPGGFESEDHYFFVAHKEDSKESIWLAFFSGDVKPQYKVKGITSKYGIAITRNEKQPDGNNIETFLTKPLKADDIAKQIDKQGKAALYNIYFDFNKADIKPESKTELVEMAKYLNAHPSTKFIVAGHTDSIGGFDYNIDLSNRRAQAVINALASLGVNKTKLKGFGAGMTSPVATNDTEEGRALNRRVELVKWVSQ